jgi:DNA-binding protein Alba
MDKYRRVEKPKSDLSDIRENEVRITTQGKMRNYISYATNLLSEQVSLPLLSTVLCGHIHPSKGEKQASEIILKAMGRAINKTVTIAEIIKRRIPGLHQITQIDSTDITDVWEPLEQGLDPVVTTRHVSSIQIILSIKQLDTNHVGYVDMLHFTARVLISFRYQPPLPADQVKPASALGMYHTCNTLCPCSHSCTTSSQSRKTCSFHTYYCNHIPLDCCSRFLCLYPSHLLPPLFSFISIWHPFMNGLIEYEYQQDTTWSPARDEDEEGDAEGEGSEAVEAGVEVWTPVPPSHNNQPLRGCHKRWVVISLGLMVVWMQALKDVGDEGAGEVAGVEGAGVEGRRTSTKVLLDNSKASHSKASHSKDSHSKDSHSKDSHSKGRYHKDKCHRGAILTIITMAEEWEVDEDVEGGDVGAVEEGAGDVEVSVVAQRVCQAVLKLRVLEPIIVC